MDRVGIRAIAHYLPAGRLDNAELMERMEFEPAFLEQKLGIKSRRIAAPDQAASDLAMAACRKLMEAGGPAPGDVELLVVCTQSPDYQLPHTAALVQHGLGLPLETASFDITLGCSGYVYALAVATALMEAQGMHNGLVVTSELYSRIMDPMDRATVAVFGDGASATWLKAGAEWLAGGFDLGTDGAGAQHLIRPAGGSRHPLPGAEESPHLYMNGREIFNFMMRRVPQTVSRCLAKSGVELEQVDRFVFHQASAYMLANLAKRMKLDPDKVIIDLAELGNTVSSTIPIALESVLAKADTEHDINKIILCGFGVGLSWATALLSRDQL